MTVSISNLFLIPMFFTLLGMFICWLYYNWRQPIREKSIHDNIYRCQECNHVYVDRRHVPMSRCDVCECMNEAIKR